MVVVELGLSGTALLVFPDRDVVPPAAELAAYCPDELGECMREENSDAEREDEDNNLNAAHTIAPAKDTAAAGAASSSS